MKTTPENEESIRCNASGCSCVCFKPGSVSVRSCDRCGHGWVAHALDRLHARALSPSGCGPVEVALPGLVFDLSSLVLYGAQAVPVRLKILLDRLYSILTPEQVGQILTTLGWSVGDYVRGYMLQSSGAVLDGWLTAAPDEELLILSQFLRFGETRPIVETMTRHRQATVTRTVYEPCVNHHYDLSPAPAKTCHSNLKTCHSNLKTFIERNSESPAGAFNNTRGDSNVTDVCCVRKNTNIIPPDRKERVRHFENIPGGLSTLLPFHFPRSTGFHCPAPAAKSLRKPSETKPPQSVRPEVGRREQENDPISHQSKVDLNPSVKIKADPDKPKNPTQVMWRQDPWLHKDRPEKSYSNDRSLNASSSPQKRSSQRFQSISPYSLTPLPSFSSSFLCPHPSFSHGRKGRVCCGVCGKSFYDKGTLKIHYNAVHLKIKHRCTVPGCTMVFSSLRSRNRHSANPNPRLHTGMGRETHTHRHTHTQSGVQTETHTHRHTDAQPGVHMETHSHRQTHTETDNHRHTQPSINTDTHIHRHTHTQPGIHTETHIHKDREMRKNMYDTNTHASIETDTQIHRHTQSSIYTDTHNHTHSHTQPNIHTDTHNHTHTQPGIQTDTHTHKEKEARKNVYDTHTRMYRENGTSRTYWRQDIEANSIFCVHTKLNSQECHRDNIPPRDDRPSNGSDGGICFKTPSPTPVYPDPSASSLGYTPSIDPLEVPVVDKTERCRNLLLSLQATNTKPVGAFNSRPALCDYGVPEGKQGRCEFGEVLPKKKPRKSNMPVKIERERKC